MSGVDFIAWLEGVACTRPFTLDDASELHALIHSGLPGRDAKVDVYTTKGDVVHVRVETEHGVISRDVPIV